MLIHELTFNDLHINPTEIYGQMGYGDTVPDGKVLSEMVETLRRIKSVVRPRFCFLIADGTLDTEQNELTISGIRHELKDDGIQNASETTFNIGSIISRQLRNSTAFAFFIATAGIEFQQLLDEMKHENDMVKMFIADAVGSVIAEKTADCMEEELQKRIAICGWKHTNRFSPGYCGWHVSQQQLLFLLFRTAEPCGVRLTESSLMMPIKSVSGVIGLGESVRKLDYSCGLCDLKTCYKRRISKA